VSHVSAPGFLVLHGLRLKGFASCATVASLSGLPDSEVETLLAGFGVEGLAQYREGRITGWSLTPEGRACHAHRCADDVEHAGCAEVIADAYRRFLGANEAFLTLCTDWQLRAGPGGSQVTNDHSDAAHDARVIARLGTLDDGIQPVCADLAETMARFAHYGRRFGAALDHVRTGDRDWFTGALIESYHTVWFELHEDLLATLGLTRDKEGVQ
jgi:hypothetical protein